MGVRLRTEPSRLEQQGLEILARNWRGRRGELDIVADNGLELVVIGGALARGGVDPLSTLVRRSVGRVFSATTEYLYRSRLENRFVRFDVVGVTGDEVEWLEDAWRPN